MWELEMKTEMFNYILINEFKITTNPSHVTINRVFLMKKIVFKKISEKSGVFYIFQISSMFGLIEKSRILISLHLICCNITDHVTSRKTPLYRNERRRITEFWLFCTHWAFGEWYSFIISKLLKFILRFCVKMVDWTHTFCTLFSPNLTKPTVIFFFLNWHKPTRTKKIGTEERETKF